MAEIHAAIDSKSMDFLKEHLGIRTNAEVTSEAYTALMWMVKERLKDRYITSCTDTGTDVARYSTKHIDYIKPIKYT